MESKLIVLVLAGALAGACSYDFETEADHFACTSDDDCVDGFVCGGHTSLDSDQPATYCVESEDVEIGVWQETMPAFQSGCTAHVWEFAWDAWMVVSENETPPPTDLPPAQAERTAFADAGGTCVGDVSPYGEIRVMCRQPKGDIEAKSAAMWVVLYASEGDPLAAQDQMAVAVASGVIDADTRLAPDEIERHHQFDEYLGTSLARCGAARQRVCPENQTSTVCVACSELAPCPLHFSCVSGTCEPNPES